MFSLAESIKLHRYSYHIEELKELLNFFSYIFEKECRTFIEEIKHEKVIEKSLNKSNDA